MFLYPSSVRIGNFVVQSPNALALKIYQQPLPDVTEKMKVICSGFPKTGTKTLGCALGTLGYQVFDFIENFWYLDKQWNDVFDHGGSVEKFKRMFENVDVVCDIPACYFWEEIHEAFPDAKVRFLYAYGL